MSSKLIILIVPGSFSPPEPYSSLFPTIQKAGYEVRALHLPTVGKKPGNPTMLDDAAFIASEIAKEADQGKDVIVLAHSYGGVPASESVKGFSKDARAKEGKKGGVVRLAYMTSLIPAVGSSGMSVMGDTMPLDYITVDEDGWMVMIDKVKCGKTVFTHLPPDQQLEYTNKFAQHSAVSFGTELTYAGYKDVPVSYLFCEEDECVPPTVQQKTIETVEKESGRKVDVTKIKGDHAPNISQTEKVAGWIVEVAQKSSQ